MGDRLSLEDVEQILGDNIDFESVGRLLLHDITRVRDHVRWKLQYAPVTKSVTKMLALLDYLSTEKSRSEILDFLEIGNQTRNFQTNIKPMLENGIIEMTLPAIPTSRHQKYRLTARGRRLLK